jgi:RNA-directed DNA polymerase
MIPKPGTMEQRPLSIPPVRDRIVQAAAKMVLEPVFEADFLPASFGFRPKRSAHDALQVLIDECGRGRRWVAETDIASCFSAIPWQHPGYLLSGAASSRLRVAICRSASNPAAMAGW